MEAKEKIDKLLDIASICDLGDGKLLSIINDFYEGEELEVNGVLASIPVEGVDIEMPVYFDDKNSLMRPRGPIDMLSYEFNKQEFGALLREEVENLDTSCGFYIIIKGFAQSKIDTIKAFRDSFDCNLKEAKEVFEANEDNLPFIYPKAFPLFRLNKTINRLEENNIEGTMSVFYKHI